MDRNLITKRLNNRFAAFLAISVRLRYEGVQPFSACQFFNCVRSANSPASKNEPLQDVHSSYLMCGCFWQVLQRSTSMPSYSMASMSFWHLGQIIASQVAATLSFQLLAAMRDFVVPCFGANPLGWRHFNLDKSCVSPAFVNHFEAISLLSRGITE